ncbi:MAG: hydroxyacid dehydrogenase [Candidatus Saccharibacteria bacterium]
MSSKPTVSLLMTPGLEDTLFNDDARQALGEYCNVSSWTPTQEQPYPDCDILLASWGCPTFDRDFLEAMPSLKMVAYAAGTVKKIVSDEFWQRDIQITSAAAANAIAVAEYTVAAMVFMAKNVRHGSEQYIDDNKDKFLALRDMPRGFNGLNIGLVGASHVGREVIRLLKSYNVKIAVYDPYLTLEEASTLGVDKMELDDLMAWSDIVSVHAPKLPATEKLIGREQLSLMQDGSFFINTARGTIVDYEALAEITPLKNIEVVIDVTDPDEPLVANSPLRQLPNVMITPHIAGSRGNEQQLMGTLAIEEIIRYVKGEPLKHQVLQAELSHIA